LYNSFLFSGSADAIIYCWNLDTETILRTLIGHSGLVSAFEVVNEDLYSGSYDTNIIKWNTETGQMIDKFPSIHFNFVKCLTGRDQSLFSGADDTYVIWWNLTSMQANLIYKNRNKKLRSIALWKSAVFSGGEDYSITMWDTGLNSVEPVAILTGHTYPVNTISVYEDDLFSGSSDTTIRQWNLLNQTFIKDFVGDIRV
jgi:WD40 repeat protein